MVTAAAHFMKKADDWLANLSKNLFTSNETEPRYLGRSIEQMPKQNWLSRMTGIDPYRQNRTQSQQNYAASPKFYEALQQRMSAQPAASSAPVQPTPTDAEVSARIPPKPPHLMASTAQPTTPMPPSTPPAPQPAAQANSVASTPPPAPTQQPAPAMSQDEVQKLLSMPLRKYVDQGDDEPAARKPAPVQPPPASVAPKTPAPPAMPKGPQMTGSFPAGEETPYQRSTRMKAEGTWKPAMPAAPKPDVGFGPVQLSTQQKQLYEKTLPSTGVQPAAYKRQGIYAGQSAVDANAENGNDLIIDPSSGKVLGRKAGPNTFMGSQKISSAKPLRKFVRT